MGRAEGVTGSDNGEKGGQSSNLILPFLKKIKNNTNVFLSTLYWKEMLPGEHYKTYFRLMFTVLVKALSDTGKQIVLEKGTLVFEQWLRILFFLIYYYDWFTVADSWSRFSQCYCFFQVTYVIIKTTNVPCTVYL